MVSILTGPEGNTLNIYDNFNIGVAQPQLDDPQDNDFINVVFTEADRGESHIFKIHKDKIDAYLNMIRDASGKKIHIATEMPHAAGI